MSGLSGWGMDAGVSVREVVAMVLVCLLLFVRRV